MKLHGLILTVLLEYAVGFVFECKDLDICASVFQPQPEKQIGQCYLYDTRISCCATCKSLMGTLGNTDPDCPWGNEGAGIQKTDTWMPCESLPIADCIFYCQKGYLFQQNCCQTCYELC